MCGFIKIINMIYIKLFKYKLNQLFSIKDTMFKFKKQSLLTVFTVINTNVSLNKQDYETTYELSKNIARGVGVKYINVFIFEGAVLLGLLLLILLVIHAYYESIELWLTQKISKFNLGVIAGITFSSMYNFNILDRIIVITQSFVTGRYQLRLDEFVDKGFKIVMIKHRVKYDEIFKGGVASYKDFNDIVEKISYDTLEYVAYQVIFECLLLWLVWTFLTCLIIILCIKLNDSYRLKNTQISEAK